MSKASRTVDGSPLILAAMVTAALMIFQQVGAKTTRDAFFLANWGVAELPKVMIGAAILSLVGALLFSRLMTRFGPARVLPGAYLIHGALFVGEWWLAGQHAGLVAVLIYLHVGALGPVVVSGFWSLVNEQLDPHAAKRLVSRIAASGAFGGVVGGLAAERLVASFPLTAMLLLLAAITGLAAVATLRMSGSSAAARQAVEIAAAAPTSREPNRYLRDLAAIVLVSATMAGLLDYALKAEASRSLKGAEALGAFFALFHAGLSVLVFLFQTALSGRALKRFGIAGSIAVLPGAVLLGGTLAVALPRLWTAAASNALYNVVRNSLYRSGYELLYTPVDQAKKRAVKALIDVGFDRFGDVVAAGSAMAVLAIAPAQASRVVVAAAMGLAVVSVLLTFRLHRGYVNALAASLKKGTLRAEDLQGLDATTQRTLTETTQAIDREQLLVELRALQAQQGSDEGVAVALQPDTGKVDSQLLGDISTLLGGSSSERQRLLGRLVDEERLAPCLLSLVVPLLGHQYLARRALAVLERHGRGREGTFEDVLVDASQPQIVRRRIPRVLRTLGTQRASDALKAALDDTDFVVRYHSARALFLLVKGHGLPLQDREHVFQLILREASIPVDRWEAPLATDTLDAAVGRIAKRGRVPTRTDYVFMLLGSVLEIEPIELCHKALHSDEPGLRGTALEYLESVLPAPVHERLIRQLDPLQPSKPLSVRGRSAEQLVGELKRAATDARLGGEAAADES